MEEEAWQWAGLLVGLRRGGDGGRGYGRVLDVAVGRIRSLDVTRAVFVGLFMGFRCGSGYVLDDFLDLETNPTCGVSGVVCVCVCGSDSGLCRVMGCRVVCDV